MLKSIWEDAKRQFSYGNMVTQLIIINVAVFILVNIVRIAIYLGDPTGDMAAFDVFIRFFSASGDWTKIFLNPWRLFTSMFLHEGTLHVLFNMLFLYWFGRIVGDFLGNQRILPIYILGGLVAGLAFIASVYLLPSVYGTEPSNAYALGASGAVMAIVAAAGMIAPNYYMNIILIGPIKLKYIAITLFLLDLFSIAGSSNTGGHIAHIGGFLMGGLFVVQLRNGNDLSIPLNRIFDSITGFFRNLFTNAPKSSPRRKKNVKVVYKNKNTNKKGNTQRRPSRSKNSSRKTKGNKAGDYNGLSHQEKLDAILDKIKKTGYDSLNAEEKEFLFNASKQV